MSEELAAKGSIVKMQPSVCLICQSSDELYAAGDPHYYKHIIFFNLGHVDDKCKTSMSSDDLFHLHVLDKQHNGQFISPTAISSSNNWFSSSDRYSEMIHKRFFGTAANRHSIKIPTRKVSWQTIHNKNLSNPDEARFKVLMKRSEISQKALQLSLPNDMSIARLKKSMLQTSYSRQLLQGTYYEKKVSAGLAAPLVTAQGNTAFEL